MQLQLRDSKILVLYPCSQLLQEEGIMILAIVLLSITWDRKPEGHGLELLERRCISRKKSLYKLKSRDCHPYLSFLPSFSLKREGLG